MYDPFSVDFDPVMALQCSPGGNGEGSRESLDDFEEAFADEQSEVARLMCELDGSLRRKSKKQMKRDRVARLEEMTVVGRRLFEQGAKVLGESSLVDIMHSQCSTGPMSLLYQAVTVRRRVEVHIRALNRVDRIARGHVVAFDRHMNLILKDVDEVALPGRKYERSFGRRKSEEDHLPAGMRWQFNGVWPYPLGVCHSVLQRHLSCSLVKGDVVVLVRLLC